MNATTNAARARRVVVSAASGALIIAGLAPMSAATAAAPTASTVLALSSKTITGVPASVAPGYHTFVLKETAAQLKKDPRGLDILQLAKGYTIAQFRADGAAAFGDKWTAAVKKAYTRLIKNTRSLGGLELEGDYTATGTSFTVLLTPGTYLLDNGPTTDGAADTYKSLTVSGASAGAKPTSIGTITSKEYAFKLVGVKAGRHVYALHDAGSQIHMYLMLRLDKGHTLAEVQAALASNQRPPSWVHSAGFAGLLSGGQTMYTSLNLSSTSDYLLVCFMPDVKTGTPHAALGMVRLFRVA
ncbi:hypothetical protein acdb102_23820 [Acidothermaceae bacterium B102]|nr:hypothetical protein acdb102_23820 [Acidothermaceae bacterium B102]